VNDEFFGKLDAQKVKKLLGQFRKMEEE
jgi:hypothetical protein